MMISFNTIAVDLVRGYSISHHVHQISVCVLVGWLLESNAAVCVFHFENGWYAGCVGLYFQAK